MAQAFDSSNDSQAVQCGSVLEQQLKSRRGYEKATRRFLRLGIMPQQLAERFPPRPEPAPLHQGQDNGCMDLGEESASPAETAVVSKLQEQFFLVEYQLPSGEWFVIQGAKYRAETAKDLIQVTQNHARINHSLRYRIRRNDGTRAVHRIAARTGKRGQVEFYKWST